MKTLYHYCCAHSVAGINRDGMVRSTFDQKPDVDLGPVTGFSWFTDLDVPIAAALGLTSFTLDCDRTEARFTVTDPSSIVPWVAARRLLPRWFVAGLEGAPGVMPMHWWLSASPVSVAVPAVFARTSSEPPSKVAPALARGRRQKSRALTPQPPSKVAGSLTRGRACGDATRVPRRGMNGEP